MTNVTYSKDLPKLLSNLPSKNSINFSKVLENRQKSVKSVESKEIFRPSRNIRKAQAELRIFDKSNLFHIYLKQQILPHPSPTTSE